VAAVEPVSRQWCGSKQTVVACGSGVVGDKLGAPANACACQLADNTDFFVDVQEFCCLHGFGWQSDVSVLVIK
jgi:hypothetical protein